MPARAVPVAAAGDSGDDGYRGDDQHDKRHDDDRTSPNAPAHDRHQLSGQAALTAPSGPRRVH
jgi:hypothetical protein